jgi:hypothetical protein
MAKDRAPQTAATEKPAAQAWNHWQDIGQDPFSFAMPAADTTLHKHTAQSLALAAGGLEAVIELLAMDANAKNTDFDDGARMVKLSQWHAHGLLHAAHALAGSISKELSELKDRADREGSK